MLHLSLKLDEAAEAIGVSRSHLEKLLKAGDIRCYWEGRIPHVTVKELERYVDARTEHERRLAEQTDTALGRLVAGSRLSAANGNKTVRLA